MYGTHLLKDLAVVMTLAAAAMLLCHRFRQPVVIGYLLAGLAIGPFTPPFSLVTDLKSIHTMAELGLVFLMFALGLEFSLPKLRRVGGSAAIAAGLEVVGMWALGLALGRFFGWNWTDSVFLGALLSMSSTTIIVKVFTDLKMTREAFAQAVFGILVLEDIVAVLILSVLSGMSSASAGGVSLVLTATLRIALFVVLFLVLGLLLVPRFLSWVGRFRSKEMTGIVTLGLCLLGSLLATKFGFSVALGAFMAGAVVAASAEIGEIEEWMHPVRDMFSAIFFVSAGMLIQPDLLWRYKWPILVVALATITGKVVCGAMGSFAAGYGVKNSVKIGMSLAQIGEFSFVIASLGAATGVTSGFLYPIAVTVSSLTTLCTPYLINRSDAIAERALASLPAGAREWIVRYEARKSAAPAPSPESLVMSKYLIRLLVYAAFLAGMIAAVRDIAGFLGGRLAEPAPWLFALWWGTALLLLPLFATLAHYGNHLLLLLATARAALLKWLDVRLFYNAMLGAHFLGLAALFLWAAGDTLRPTALYAMGGFALLGAVVLRRQIPRAAEKVEGLLDEVLGLATSEPTRQAVLRLGGHDAVHTEQVVVKAGSPAADRTIRDLRIRELTGASVAAIYRNGRHLANPGAETVLLPEDVLVLFGSEEECEKARAALA